MEFSDNKTGLEQEASPETKKRLEKIIASFFLSEPLLFSVLQSHSLVENSGIPLPLRTGQMRIEYSSLLIQNIDDKRLEELLKIEALRILLLHPYKRLPYKAKKSILLLASDLAIYPLYQPENLNAFALSKKDRGGKADLETSGKSDHIKLEDAKKTLALKGQSSSYSKEKPDSDNLKSERFEYAGVTFLKEMTKRFHQLTFPLGEKWSGSDEEKFFLRNLNVDSKSGKLLLIDRLNYEQWYRKLLFLIENTSIKGQNAGSAQNFSENLLSSLDDSASELWEENEEAQKAIQDNIKRAVADQGWGSLGGNTERKILEESQISMNYRRILAQFKAQIINSKRNLTRMKPSRRFGFSQMGSRYERKANILVAVDTSGSISDENFSKFFKAINNFFFCGIEKLDAIFFDVALKKSRPLTLKKRFKISEIQGKGGTNFQVPVDFFLEHQEYDGLIIFTDGEASPPSLYGKKRPVLWILTDRASWEKSLVWTEKLLKCRSTYIP